MSEVRVADRYAKALIDLAGEKQVLEAIYQDAAAFLSVCENSRDFEVVLSNPVISQHKKHNIVKKVFSDTLSTDTVQFINLIIQKQRGALLVPIFERVVVQYKQLKGITSATVYAPISLSKDVQEKLKGFVKQGIGGNVNQVELTSKVDDTLLGGFVLRFEDKLLDKSVNSQLKAIRKAFKN